MSTHPLPRYTRVHHRACEWSYGYTPEEQREHPSWGWATVLAVHSGPYSDGSYEYLVRKDAPLLKGGELESQWASYHIDQRGSA